MLYLNIQDFGAKGDGKTDDTAALIRALEAVSKENGTLYFPKGNYLIHPVQVPSHVTLMGNSAWGGPSGDAGALGHTRLTALSGDARALLDLDKCMGTRIIGLTLDGQNLGTEFHGVYSCHGGVEQNNCYEDCLICNFTGSGLKMDWVWVFAVRRCRITANRLYGIDVDRGYDGWVVDNCIEGNGLWGVNAGPGMVCYTANLIRNNQEGGLLADDTQNVNITGNRFDGNGGPGLAIRNSRSIAVSGNSFHQNGLKQTGSQSCALLAEDSTGISIMGNTLSSTEPAAYGLIARRLSGSAVSANTLPASVQTARLLAEDNTDTFIESNC